MLDKMMISYDLNPLKVQVLGSSFNPWEDSEVATPLTLNDIFYF